MPHDTPLISMLVGGLVLAFIFGALANRFRMPPLVGYLIAGIVCGPFTPGFVADGELANELMEIGVILLMFGVGLHFSLKDLLSVQAVAVPGALLRILGGTVMGLILAWVMGWSTGAGIVFGLALSVASTVVLLNVLQERHLIDSDRGRIAVGWVIVEDIAMILALVLIPAFSAALGGTVSPQSDPFVRLVERLVGFQLEIWAVLGITVIKLAAFIGFMLVVGRRVIPALLHFTAHTGSRELFRLAVLAIALGVAAGASYLFGVSLALGAFFAGMILSESELSHRAAQESLPLRDAFSVLFFVAVGMLFDWTILVERPWEVLGTVLIIVLGKALLGFLLVIGLRRPVSAALTISASLAQIGEFSFILGALAVGLGIMPPEGQSLILAGSIISIVVNPLLFFIADRLTPRLEARLAVGGGPVNPTLRAEPSLEAALPSEVAYETPTTSPVAIPGDERLPTRKSGHIVLVGYGRVGGVVAEGLLRSNTPFVLIEDAEGRVSAAHAAGIEVVVGNAATPRSLALANVEAAKAALIAIPNAFEAGQATEQCRRHNPGIRIIARAHSDEEINYLTDLGADHVIMGEREIGIGMLGWITGDNQHEVDTQQNSARMAAVAAALHLDLGPPPKRPPPPVEPVSSMPVAEPVPPPLSDDTVALLEAAIEAAHPQHPDTGPAEPPVTVPALGEMEDMTTPSAPTDAMAAAAVGGTAAPEPDLEPVMPRARVSAPATSPASPFRPEPAEPFNPEVPPAPSEEKA